MGFDELAPLDVQAGRFENINLHSESVERDEWIFSPMGYEKSLLASNRRQLLEGFLRLVHVTTDSDQAGQQVRIAQTRFPGHQTTL